MEPILKNVIDTYQRENFNIKYLSTNYRSTQNIIRAADYVIKHNKARFDKDSETNNEIGSKIKFGVYTSTAEETKDIVKEIKRLHDECGKNIVILLFYVVLILNHVLLKNNF